LDSRRVFQGSHAGKEEDFIKRRIERRKMLFFTKSIRSNNRAEKTIEKRKDIDTPKRGKRVKKKG
jgi:hypothetical protein